MVFEVFQSHILKSEMEKKSIGTFKLNFKNCTYNRWFQKSELLLVMENYLKPTFFILDIFIHIILRNFLSFNANFELKIPNIT